MMQPSVTIVRMRHNGPAESMKFNRLANQTLHDMRIINDVLESNSNSLSDLIISSNQLVADTCHLVKAVEDTARAYAQED